MAKKKKGGWTPKTVLVTMAVVFAILVLLIPPLRLQLIEGLGELTTAFLSIALPVAAVVVVFAVLFRRRH